ncbi:MAG: tetratricopeptide repeat protein [Flavobacteriaceae bacterium]
MNATEFTYLLKHPANFSSEQISDVNSIINEFPYFQSARAMYLKGLKDKGSFKYNQELKTTAAYTTDRSILFDFITSEAFQQNEISEQIQQNAEYLKNIEVTDIEDISVNKSVLIDDALKQHIRDTEATLDPKLFEAKEVHIKPFSETIISVDEPIKVEKTAEEQLELGKPLEFDKNELHSFSEWLKITSFKPIIRDDEPAEKHPPITQHSLEEKLNLIDKFIEAKPKITPVKHEGQHINLANTNNIKPESLMTETLARIYLEQKQYEKAIQAYKILSLKYPEKSGFFADQIRAIKEIQE